MAKKIINDKVESSISLFNSVGGIIGTILTIGSLSFGAGLTVGSWRKEIEYENMIRDFKYDRLQLEVEYQKKLENEKDKWENNQEQKMSLQEISLFFKNFNEYQKAKK